MEKKSKPFQADKYLADGIDIAAYIDEAMLGHVRNDGGVQMGNAP